MASTPTATGESLHIGPQHNSKRLRKLLKPNGRRVHVAGTPEEHRRLQRTLSTTEPDEHFDVYIHGSPEHLDAVREIHAHHDQRRNDLRQKHGDLYDDFEDVHLQLDILSKELHMLTEHGVSLDANFSKFGYAAHLRTREPDSSASSVTFDHSSAHERRDWDAERRKGTALRFWKRPVVRQYFHKGLIWRAAEIEEVASFELFMDLLYVGIIAIVGDNASANPNGIGLLRFAITFILGWKMWSDLTLIVSWFDDIFQRFCVLFVMISLFGYNLNISEAFNTTYARLISFYLAQRLFSGVSYLWMAYLIPMVRGYMIGNAIIVAIPSVLWIASVHLDYPNRLAIIWIAILLDLFGALWLMFITMSPRLVHPKLQRRIRKFFVFVPAVNIEHKTERTNAFVTLVFGYSVVNLLYQNKAPYGVNAFFGKAALGLIQAFCFNWLYFDIDGYNLHTHAIRRHVISSTIWVSAHLPFIMSYVLAGASLSKLVLASDCINTDKETLGEAYIGRSESEIAPGLRWFYCAGLGIALGCMGIISLTHAHKEIEGQRVTKCFRLIFRAAISIVLICLPLAHSLTSLGLISTTTGLVVLTLCVDLYGSTCVHDPFWREKTKCKYMADCQVKRKAIERALKEGVAINVEEEARGTRGEKGFYELS